MSSYNPLIPTGLVNLDEDYINIQNNFQQLDTTFNVDHTTFSNDTADNGEHNYVHMVQSFATAQMPPAPFIPTVKTGQTVLYNRADANGLPQLFFKANNRAFEYQLTTEQSVNASEILFGQNPGWTFLPGNLILQYGFTPMSGSAVSTTFPIKFPASCFCVVLTPRSTSVNFSSVFVIPLTISQTGFNTKFIYSGTDPSTSIAGYGWTAIGN